MEPIAQLKKFFQSLGEFPVLDWAYLATQLRVQTYAKGETIFKSGEPCDRIGFIVSGLVYSYYLSEKGQLYVKNFAWEGRLLAPYVSILTQSDSNFTAEALEKTTILSMSGETLRKLYDKEPYWERIGRKNAEALLIQREKREYESLTMSTLQRYESFREEFAPIMGRIPQHLIAGYLGINPVSLSRLLKQSK